MPRILLVEDNEMNQDIISRRLNMRGYQVTIAVDGEDGVRKAAELLPDLILMDLSLPIIDGWEASRQIKAEPTTAAIPIIALTAHALEEHRQRALEAGCDDYDTKPVDLPRLLSKIAALVSCHAKPPAKPEIDSTQTVEPSATGTQTQPALQESQDAADEQAREEPETTGDVQSAIASISTPRARIDETPVGDRGHVLVVDDNPANRDLLCRSLDDEGFTWDVAASGEEALQTLENSDFDLVLLDIMMPGIDGYEVLSRMKADTAFRHLPVIVISAQGPEAAIRCIEMGADDYLTKPFDRTLLRARTSACVEKKRLRDAELGFRQQLEREKRRADDLLNALFPHLVVQELKATNRYQPRRHQEVAVLFCDIVSFTPFCDAHSPEEVVDHLQNLVTRFEEVAAKNDVQKIKTIGDAFMGASGLVNWVENPVLQCVRCGLEMIAAARRTPPAWEVRIGIHAGPVVAGIVGSRQYALDIWGSTVNIASRVQTAAEPGTVCVSESAWQQISHLARGESRTVPLRGLGDLEIVRMKEFL